MGSEGSKPGDYQEAELPEGVLEVRASVYKLKLTGYSVIDEIGSGFLGAFHSGLVVAGREYAYGGSEEDDSSGVYHSDPEMNDNYHFYKRVVLGRISKTPAQVRTLIEQFAASPAWAGSQYNLMEHNCNHFVSDLSWFLLKKRLPEWVNATADSVRLQTLVKDTFVRESDEAFSDYCRLLTGASESANELPGERAFRSTFEQTFYLAWERGSAAREVCASTCPEGVDPETLKRERETSSLAFAAEAARVAACVVAAASRVAKMTREKLLEFEDDRFEMSAWDDAWKKASAPLLKTWREDTLSGLLRLDNFEASEQLRMAQVEDALKIAATAAEQAAEETRSARDAGFSPKSLDN